MLQKLLIALPLLAGAVSAAAVRLSLPLRLGDGRSALFLAEPWEPLGAGAVAALWLALLFGRRRSVLWRRAFALATLALAVGIAATILPSRAPRRVALAAAGGDPPPARRTLLVGIDGLSWSRLLPLAAAGKLPHFEGLMREGSAAALRSHRATRPTSGESGFWSPVVWTSIATGVGAERHGIEDFNLANSRGGLDLAASGHRKVPAFWNLFSAFGRRVGVVGWWVSWPAEEVSGFMVSSGMGLRGLRSGDGDATGMTYPPELFEELMAAVPPDRDVGRLIDQRLFPLSSYPILAERDRETFENVVWQDRYYLDLASHLLARESPELLAVYFEGIDLVGHLFWRYREHPERLVTATVPPGFREHARIVDRYYMLIDGYLGNLLASVGDETTVVVCSDHGFRDAATDQLADHDEWGVLLVRGAGVRRGDDLNLSLATAASSRLAGQPTVLDLLPTLLYMHGLPISDQLEGRVLHELFEREVRRRQPQLRVPDYGDFATTRRVDVELPEADREEYLERLRSLGYID